MDDPVRLCLSSSVLSEAYRDQAVINIFDRPGPRHTRSIDILRSIDYS